MKRFLATALLLLCAVSVAHAEKYTLSNGVTVSDELPSPPVTFDKSPADMTDAEFAEWANKRNKSQEANAAKRHKRYLEERGPLKTQDFAGSSSSNTVQMGGGYGMGGHGGYGGYLGYGNHVLGNYGGQAGGQGNRISTESSSSSYSRTDTYPDMNDNGGGPVNYVNPFCRKYFADKQPPKPAPEPVAQAEPVLVEPKAELLPVDLNDLDNLFNDADGPVPSEGS